MDSDDIMYNNRIVKQLDFMNENPEVQVCGAQVTFFKENIENKMYNTNHPSITWEEYIKIKSHWITNHPTLCYRKSAVLEVGNYDKTKSKMTEDFEIALKLLKRYKYIYNFPEPNLYYRIHNEQITNNGGTEGREHWNKIRNDLVNDLVNS